MVSVCLLAPVQSFVAQPLACITRPPSAAAVSMSLSPMDRRAALSGAATALFALAQNAHAATLAADEDELKSEKGVLAAADEALAKAGSKELADEIALKKAQDAVLAAMKKGDDAEVKKLQAKVKALMVQEAADEKTKLALASEVKKDAAQVKAFSSKVRKEEADEVALETKEILQAEETVLEVVVGKDTSNVVSKFFKQ